MYSVKKIYFLLTLSFCVLVLSCNAENNNGSLQTLVSGSFTAGEDFDASEGLGGYAVFIVDRGTEPVDTLYRAVTDEAGSFGSEASFQRNGEYPILVEKDNRRVAAFTLILAENDTVHITGELPDIDSARTVTSTENEALRTYRRLDNQYYRIVNLINAGAVEEDEIEELVNTWADLFWTMREDHPNTIAAQRATSRALEVIDGWNDYKTMEWINSNPEDEALQEDAIYYGTLATIRLEGLDGSLSFLDELEERVQGEENRRLIAMNKVELLFDSLRVDQAREMLDRYQYRFQDNPDSAWASVMSYEINNLAPGMTMPDFEFSTTGEEYINRESLQGSPYLIEIVELANRGYQGIHPVLTELVAGYTDVGFKLITVPIEHSPITINAFYEERSAPWAVAASRSYEEAGLIEKFNISRLPTRILVDGDGNIVRKYAGNNLRQLEEDIETLIQ